MKVILTFSRKSWEESEFILFSPSTNIGLGLWSNLPEFTIGVLKEIISREGESVEIIMDSCSKRSGKYIEITREDMSVWKNVFDNSHWNLKRTHKLGGIKNGICDLGSSECSRPDNF